MSGQRSRLPLPSAFLPLGSGGVLILPDGLCFDRGFRRQPWSSRSSPPFVGHPDFLTRSFAQVFGRIFPCPGVGELPVPAAPIV
ncbi:photosystem I subunit O [Iris pallida]|uniref:Photosystem I subunit O n=1 Tax=Iris pallida TaxID=29817 RepID=A0AAX6H9R5_IRIPA|nr:photosystem I subunit O [Iris pallida]